MQAAPWVERKRSYAPRVARPRLLAVLEIRLEILPGKDLQLPIVAVLGRPGHHVGAGIAGAVIRACGDGEVAAFHHSAVGTGELVLRVVPAKVDR